MSSRDADQTSTIGALEGYVVRERDDADPVLELHGRDGDVVMTVDSARHAQALSEIASEIYAELTDSPAATTGEWDRAPTATGRWPPQFEAWPHDQQITEVEMQFQRAGLLRALLSKSGLPVEDEVRFDRKLRKDELAAIYLQIEGIANAE